MLHRTGEMAALFETLGVLSCALMACLSRGWRTAIGQARAQIPSVEDLDFAWLDQQEQLWAECDENCVEFFRDNFVMSVLPRFYTGLRKLSLGYLHRATDYQSRRLLELDHRFPAVDEALARVTLRCTQLRELDVRQGMSNVSLTIVASNCRNLQKLTCGSADGGGLISDVGLAALAQGCKQLEHLQIIGGSYSQPQPEFTQEGVMAVARSCCLLKTLELMTSSVVEDPALVALGQHCPLLRKLSCPGWDRITDAAVAALVRGCPQLEVVELRGAERITDASASALAQGCPSLKTLNLLQTGVTAAGVLTLAKHAKQKLTITTGSMLDGAARALEAEYPVEVITYGFAFHHGAIHFEDPVEGSTYVHIKVVSQDGNEVNFQIKETTYLKRLMHAFCARQGISTFSVRFLFDGSRINENQTPAQLDMESGDVIDVMVEQQGFLPWSTAPVVVPAAGDALLLHATHAAALSPAEVAALVATAAGPHAKPGRQEVVESRPLLSAAQCKALVTAAECAGASSTLELSCQELGDIVGAAALEALCALGRDTVRASRPGAAPAEVPLRIAVRRRVAAPAERIHFHRDGRRVVVHVPLNDDYAGGQLLLALGGCEVRAAPATPGVGTAIDNAVVHGVSCVTTGVRHTLLAVFDDDE